MIENFEVAPFEPYAPLAGITLQAGQRVLGGQRMSMVPERVVLWLRQGGRCFYCDEPMVISTGPYQRKKPVPLRSMTIDHILPREIDRTRKGPKVAACFSCNTTRGSMLAHEFVLLRFGANR